MSSRKSVSTDACNSSMRARARVNSVRSRRIVALALEGVMGVGRDAVFFVPPARGATLRSAEGVLRRLAPAVTLVFFVIAPFKRLAGIHQDRIVHSRPLATPCRT